MELSKLVVRLCIIMVVSMIIPILIVIVAVPVELRESVHLGVAMLLTYSILITGFTIRHLRVKK